MLDDTLQVLVLALQKQNRNSKNKIKTLVKMGDFSFNQSIDGRLQNSAGPGL